MRLVLLVVALVYAAMPAISKTSMPGSIPGACHWDRVDGALRLGGVHVPRRHRPGTCFALPAATPDAAEGLRPRPALCSANHTRHDNLCLRRLTQRVARLEAALSRVCAAIVHAAERAGGG